MPELVLFYSVQAILVLWVGMLKLLNYHPKSCNFSLELVGSQYANSSFVVGLACPVVFFLFAIKLFSFVPKNKQNQKAKQPRTNTKLSNSFIILLTSLENWGIWFSLAPWVTHFVHEVVSPGWKLSSSIKNLKAQSWKHKCKFTTTFIILRIS